MNARQTIEQKCMPEQIAKRMIAIVERGEKERMD